MVGGYCEDCGQWDENVEMGLCPSCAEHYTRTENRDEQPELDFGDPQHDLR